VFRSACTKALGFTYPVIFSQRAASGKCGGGIGAFAVLNHEGWIATCFHISEAISRGFQSEANARQLDAEKDKINADGSLSNTQKRKKIDTLPKLKKNDIDRFAVVWGINSGGIQVAVPQFHVAPAVDLAIGKMEPFDPAWIPEYPTLKDPTKNFGPGAILCRAGYPFHSITPTWDDTTNGFQFPQTALPIPTFAIDGMLTRLVNVEVPGLGPPPFPMMLFETSSPGLRGQSGGPVFDQDGTIWGLQTDTVSYPLGFDPEVPSSNPPQKIHQFLNVGRCIHAASIKGLLDKVGLNYNLSAD
jgi:hypothetical protein